MTTTPLTDQQLAAELLLKNQLAAAFEHMDAYQWGYDHGFCGEYGVDPETDSFVDTALALVRPELDRLAAELATSRSENTRLCGEITGARATIDHMSKAMSWICGHDRQGLDHLEEAQREVRGRESAVKEARRWAARTEQAEAELGRVRAELTTAQRLSELQLQGLEREAERTRKLRAELAAVLAVCDAAEHQALRWENPLPVPEWVTDIRTAAAVPSA